MNEEVTCEICPHCGAKMVEYRFCFNRGLAVFLGKLFDAGGPAKTHDLGLTYAQRTNSQKLRYWGLATPVITEETARKRGWWKITPKGIDFVIGKISIHKFAVTKRNVILRLEGEQINFTSVSGGYSYRADYADQARRQLLSLDDDGNYQFKL